MEICTKDGKYHGNGLYGLAKKEEIYAHYLKKEAARMIEEAGRLENQEEKIGCGV